MTDLQMSFSQPWLLFLLIPALFLVLFPYFRSPRKYRRTRNRITSVVLGTLVMILGVFVLSGVYFTYDIPNSENEVLLLVDISDSGAEAEEARDDFIQSVVAESDSSFKLGIVTFGYGQVYAAEMTTDADSAYRSYMQAERPDGSASDVESALRFARGLLSKPETAKLVVISDGIETDGNALSAVKAIAADGVKVDTVCFSVVRDGNEVQLNDIVLPDYSVKAGETATIGLMLQSSYVGDATITLYDAVYSEDTGEYDQITGTPEHIVLSAGVQTIGVEHVFAVPGMHRLHFTVNSADDTALNNNIYYSYIDLQVYDKILIVRRSAAEADRLREVLDESYETVDVVDITSDAMPKTAEALRAYDEVIMMNVARSEMPDGLETALNTYVKDYGGGMLTVGGNKTGSSTDTPEPNAYDRQDLYGSLYQEMLPVEAIEYTPPLGVVIVIDRSGSMQSVDSSTGKTKLDLAKEGAISCLNVMTSRDYCGVITLETSYHEDLTLTPVTQMHKIRAAIEAIGDDGGSTEFGRSIEHAGRALNAASEARLIEKKHIIIVSDGEPTDSVETYGAAMRENAKNGITMSVVIVGGTNKAELKNIVEEIYGEGHFYNVRNGEEVTSVMREDLKVDAIKSVTFNPDGYEPRISRHTNVTNEMLELLKDPENKMPKLYGYYGTRTKGEAETILSGEFVPMYAQWKYGAGAVGSFMCDLSGVWSDEFLKSAVGRAFIRGAVNSLFPSKDIGVGEISASLSEDNYSTNISIFTELDETQTLEITVTPPSGDGTAREAEQKYVFTADDNYTRLKVSNLGAGLHRIDIVKKNADGKEVASYTTYRAFSYSKEYDGFADVDAGVTLMSDLARSGGGIVLNDPAEIFADAQRSFARTYDPRVPLVIIALILFLLDIAVRKFKFKWLHEIVRDRKTARADKKASGGKR